MQLPGSPELPTFALTTFTVFTAFMGVARYPVWDTVFMGVARYPVAGHGPFLLCKNEQ